MCTEIVRCDMHLTAVDNVREMMRPCMINLLLWLSCLLTQFSNYMIAAVKFCVQMLVYMRGPLFGRYIAANFLASIFFFLKMIWLIK